MSALNIDDPGEDGLFGLHQLQITGDYKSSAGGKDIDILGLDFERLPNDDLRFWLINHRPAIDEFGNLLDATVYGANSTVEVFDLTPGTSKLKFVKTYHDDAIQTPNSITATGDGGFVVSNDHGSNKVGAASTLSISISTLANLAEATCTHSSLLPR